MSKMDGPKIDFNLFKKAVCKIISFVLGFVEINFFINIYKKK